MTGSIERSQSTISDSFSWEPQWTVHAGSSNQIVVVTNIQGSVTNVVTFTNLLHLTDTWYTTNLFGEFASTYSLAQASLEESAGSHTVTNRAHVTRSLIQELDDTFDAMAGYYVCTNAPEATNDAFNGWFALTNSSATRPSDFPKESKAGIFSSQGIGLVKSLTTNTWGHVSGGTAYWTRSPPRSNGWLLAETHYTSSGWVAVEVGPLDVSITNADMFPIAEYMTTTNNTTNGVTTGIGGTNPPPASWSITVADDWLTDSSTLKVDTNGQLYLPNQIEYSPDQETVVVTGTSGHFTNRWYQIASWWGGIDPDEIQISVDGANTGDVIRILYTNNITLYQDNDAALPYQLYAEDLDERQAALRPLLWSSQQGELVSNANVGTYHWTGYGYPAASSNLVTNSTAPAWPGAKADTSQTPSCALSGTVLYDQITWPTFQYGIAYEYLVLSGEYRSGWNFQTTDITCEGTVSFTPPWPEVAGDYYLRIEFEGAVSNLPGTGGDFSLVGRHTFTAQADGSNVFQVTGSGRKIVYEYGSEDVVFSKVTFTTPTLTPYVDAYRWNGAISYTHDPTNHPGFLATNKCSKELYVKADWQNVATNYSWDPEISPCPSPAAGLGTNSPTDQYIYYRLDTYATSYAAPTNTDGVLAITIPYSTGDFGVGANTLGWRLDDALWLLKWDVTGGFDMQ